MGERILLDGICEFCNQAVQFDEEILHEAKGDKLIASKLVCDCANAEIYKRRRRNIYKGIERVDEIVGKGSYNPASEKVVGYLHEAVKYIVNRDMQKVVVCIDGTEKVTLCATKKGIKVSREKKNTQDSEVEMPI